ncbi:MAG: acetyltransferase [Oscillospiraceae bacterium]|nr:acetyltransferase [Oscillospiraceae bacterium]
MREKVMLIGGGGHAKVIMDIVQACGDTVVGLLDDGIEIGTVVQGVPVVGAAIDAEKFTDCRFIVAVGNNVIRHRIVDALALRWYTAVHPSAVISPNAVIGEGSVVMPAAVVNAGAKVGRHCIINTAAVVEHDNVIGDYAHVSCGAVLTGAVHVGEEALVGAAAVVRNNVHICAGCIVGAGSVVITDMKEKGTYAGIPARKMA